jgi:predicted AAA+ superfamily ATPase
LLSRDIITEFRGRGDELHMNPLPFAEFMSVYEGNKYDGWHEYVLYGGLLPWYCYLLQSRRSNF